MARKIEKKRPSTSRKDSEPPFVLDENVVHAALNQPSALDLAFIAATLFEIIPESRCVAPTSWDLSARLEGIKFV